MFLLCEHSKEIRRWGVSVVEWLARRLGDREVRGSNPAAVEFAIDFFFTLLIDVYDVYYVDIDVYYDVYVLRCQNTQLNTE